jgi:hypothetical protein
MIRADRSSRGQPFGFQLIEQGLDFVGQIEALASERGAHRGTAAANFGDFGVGEAGHSGHMTS